MTGPDPLLTMVVGGIVAAFALGFLAHRLGLSPIVGYLLAGVLIGNYTPGFTADPDVAGDLADFGAILIMFGIGLKFSPRKLASRRWLVAPCALGQILAVSGLGFGVGSVLGLEAVEALIFGYCLSIASTIVLLRVLEERGLTTSPAGDLAMCWLIVQDLTAVLVILMMPVIAQDDAALSAHAILRAFGAKALALAIFGLIMLVIGRRILPALLVFVARAKSRELFSLGAFAIALGIAYAAQAVFATSFALGAFIAGLALNEAELSHRAAEDLTPLRDAFAVLFFVSVGMLFKPQILVTETWTVLAVLAVIVVGNWGAAYLVMTAVKLPPAQKLALASGLAQIGEFSFLVSGFGLSLGLVSERTHILITAGALLAITINPVIYGMAQLIARRSRAPTAGEVAESA